MSAEKYRFVLINGPEKPEKKRMASKKRKSSSSKKRRKSAKKNPANPSTKSSAPKKRGRRRGRRNGARRSFRRMRRNPEGGKLRGLTMGAIAGVSSELIDYGTDQISSVSPNVQAGASVVLHAATAVAAAFIDPCLEAGLVATGIKTLSQRVRAQIALAPPKAEKKLGPDGKPIAAIRVPAGQLGPGISPMGMGSALSDRRRVG